MFCWNIFFSCSGSSDRGLGGGHVVIGLPVVWSIGSSVRLFARLSAMINLSWKKCFTQDTVIIFGMCVLLTLRFNTLWHWPWPCSPDDPAVCIGVSQTCSCFLGLSKPNALWNLIVRKHFVHSCWGNNICHTRQVQSRKKKVQLFWPYSKLSWFGIKSDLSLKHPGNQSSHVSFPSYGKRERARAYPSNAITVGRQRVTSRSRCGWLSYFCTAEMSRQKGCYAERYTIIRKL